MAAGAGTLAKMPVSPSALVDRARSPEGKKMIRYTMVSVISVVVSQAVLLFCFGLLHWSGAFGESS